jgi:hypothetical protein
VNPEKAFHFEDVQNNLETTHYKYKRLNESWIEAAATFKASKKIQIGVEITEKMLKNGTILFAFGRLEKLADNSFVISRPLNKFCPFILTAENRFSYIGYWEFFLRIFKVAVVFFGTATAMAGIETFIKDFKISTDEKEKGL